MVQKLVFIRIFHGKVYGIKPICSHLGCELSFNNLEKTWDCPCHVVLGLVILVKSLYDPSIKDLDVIDLD